MASGVWVVLVIPAIIAFIFGVWVFYNMVVDVTERGYSITSCIEGCQRPPLDLG